MTSDLSKYMSKNLVHCLECGGVIRDQVAGDFPIPDFYSRYWDVNCEWTLESRFKGALMVVMVDATTLLPSYIPCR